MMRPLLALLLAAAAFVAGCFISPYDSQMKERLSQNTKYPLKVLVDYSDREKGRAIGDGCPFELSFTGMGDAPCRTAFSPLFENADCQSGGAAHGLLGKGEYDLFLRMMPLDYSKSAERYNKKRSSADTRDRTYGIRVNMIVEIIGDDGSTILSDTIHGVGHDDGWQSQSCRHYHTAATQAAMDVDTQMARMLLAHPNPIDHYLAARTLKKAKREKDNESNPNEKLPIECIVQFPPNLESVKAQAFFDRSLIINFERQSATSQAVVGGEFARALLAGLENRCAKVTTMTPEVAGQPTAHNPHALACFIEVKLDTPVVAFKPESRVTIPAKLVIKAPTGGIFKNADITSTGAARISSLGGQLLSVFLLGNPLKVVAEGPIVTAALRNGSEEAIGRSVDKTVSIFQPAFASQFAEFSSYDAALKTRSPADLRSFLNLYPESLQRAEIEAMLDEVSFDSAQASGSLELYVDYVRSIPRGKHATEAREAALAKAREQIERGNVGLCDVYCELQNSGADHDGARSADCSCH